MAKYASAIIHHFQQLGLLPNALYHLTVVSVELSQALDAVVVEISLEIFPIRQHYLASALLGVFAQIALIELPVILQKVKVRIIEGSTQFGSIVVVNLSKSIEFVFSPIALVGQLATEIVEFTVAVHLVVLPMPLIIASILVIELAQSVPHPLTLKAFIATASLVVIDGVFFVTRFF